MDRSRIERRVGRFAQALGVDPARVMAWGFARAVLSTLWEIEDAASDDAIARSIALAETLRPLVDAT
jgi:streptomycin 6-kinase